MFTLSEKLKKNVYNIKERHFLLASCLRRWQRQGLNPRTFAYQSSILPRRHYRFYLSSIVHVIYPLLAIIIFYTISHFTYIIKWTYNCENFTVQIIKSTCTELFYAVLQSCRSFLVGFKMTNDKMELFPLMRNPVHRHLIAIVDILVF